MSRYSSGQRTIGCFAGSAIAFLGTCLVYYIVDTYTYASGDQTLEIIFMGMYFVCPFLALVGAIFGPAIWDAFGRWRRGRGAK